MAQFDPCLRVCPPISDKALYIGTVGAVFLKTVSFGFSGYILDSFAK